MKRKKKIVVVLVILVLLFFTIGIIANKLLHKKKNETVFNVKEFKNVKELLEYYNCTDIHIYKSYEKGFDKDIYTCFELETIEENGDTNKEYYENIISLVSAMMNNRNYRIIDKSKNINIEVVFREDGSAAYSINEDGKYFENNKSKQALNNMTNEQETTIDIKSNELNTIINNNWEKTKIEKILGNMEKEEKQYKVYSNGISIKTISSKLYNVIFNTDYKKEVFKGITTNMDNTKIMEILGKPNYDNEDSNSVIGYRTNEFYVFFSEGEISIYRVEKFNETENLEFANFFTEFNTTGEYKLFIDRLTDLYPDYEIYEQKDNYVDIRYPLRGFEIVLGKNRDNGLYIYGNYQGLITNTKSLENAKNNGETIANVFFKTNENLVFTNECNRVAERITGRELYVEPDIENIIIKDSNIYQEVETPLEQTDDEGFQKYVNELKANGEFKINY